MTGIVLRAPLLSELDDLSRLMLRSKAHWGYDPSFLDACAAELSLSPQDIAESTVIVATREGQLAGVAKVTGDQETAELSKLFVDPAFIGTGLGRHLFDWCVATAKDMTAHRMTIESDPQAAPFYVKMGAQVIGTVPSGSIPGRHLPLLEYRIR